MATSLNKYSFRCIHMLTPFCIETNLRENRIFASDGQLASKKGTHSVKFPTVYFTFNQTTNNLERRQKGDQTKHGPTLKTTLATAFSAMRVKITLTHRLV